MPRRLSALSLVLVPLLAAGLVQGAAAAAPSSPATAWSTLGAPAAAATSRPAAATPVDRISLRAVRAVGGLVQPVAVTSARDGSGRLFVAERRGTVRVVVRGRVLPGFYADLRRVVNSAGGEQGLLGIAFAPGFARRPFVFVTFTARDGALVLARLTASRAAAPAVSIATLRTVLTVPHPGATNHNGGSVFFNRDGFLYLGTGDGGGGGDPSDNARRLTTLSGKVLRIDVFRACGGKRYCVPATNPFARTRGARPEIWLLGLRNPWRASADAVTGELWIGDVGQGAWEEIDRIAYLRGGFDLGWPCREGTHSYDPARCVRGRPRVAPVVEICHPDSVPGCSDAVGAESIIGGHVYRGSAQPILTGAYLFGDFITGNLWLHRNGATAVVGSAGGITSFGETDAREPVAVTIGGDLLVFRASARA